MDVVGSDNVIFRETVLDKRTSRPLVHTKLNLYSDQPGGKVEKPEIYACEHERHRMEWDWVEIVTIDDSRSLLLIEPDLM